MVAPNSTGNDTSLNLVLHALSHPIRRSIISQLTETDISVRDLASTFSISKPALTKHLNVLEKAHLLRRQPTGRTSYCHLTPEPLIETLKWLKQYELFWTTQLDALEHFLDQDT
jgi:DNA-binding transcriptional ArsR family regulator